MFIMYRFNIFNVWYSVKDIVTKTLIETANGYKNECSVTFDIDRIKSIFQNRAWGINNRYLCTCTIFVKKSILP